MSEQVWTTTKILDWTTEYFQKKNIESARLDAELLLAHVLNLSRIQLYMQFDKPLTEFELKTFKALIKRRAEQEPVAYIIGKKEFWSREFTVKPGVLIPRPDTEVLVEVVLEKIKKINLITTNNVGAQFIEPEKGSQNTGAINGTPTQMLHAFELGTGSGAIGITLLKELPQIQLTAIEMSATAYEVTLENARKHEVEHRLNLIKADFLNELQQLEAKNQNIPDTKYDFIVSNPPYITAEEFQTLSPTITKYEPKEALVAEDNGLLFYKALARFAKLTLKENGFLAVEIGETQGESVKEIFHSSGFRNTMIKKDYAGLNRVVVAEL